MRSSLGLGLLLCAALTAGRAAGQTGGTGGAGATGATGATGGTRGTRGTGGTGATGGTEATGGSLATCAQQCADQLLTQHDCRPSQQCFCDDHGDVRDAWTQCLMTECPDYSDQLEASSVRADACDAPKRDRSQLLSIVAYVLFGVAVVCLLARLASRLPSLGGAGYGWDDFVALSCLAPLTALTVAIYYAVQHGEGRDIWTLHVEHVVSFHTWLYIGSVMHVLVVFGTKMSLVLLYLRVWSEKSNVRVVCWITLALLAAALVAFEVTTIAQCRPVSSQWTRFNGSGSHGQCVDRRALLLAVSGASIGFHVLVIVLPVRRFIQLNVSWTKRIGAGFLLLVALAALAMSIARIAYIHDFVGAFNATYYYSFISLYSAVEAYLSQIWCCLPGIDGLVRRSWSAATTTFRPLSSKKSSHESIRISAPLQIPDMQDPDGIHTPRAVPDLEKAKTAQPAEPDYDDDDDDESAPPPVVQRSSYNSFALKHRSSFEPIIEKIENQRSTYRSSATTAATRNFPHRTSTTANTNTTREPEILYQDPENRLHLAIHDPPDEPLTAQLQYVDKNAVVHDVQLQGPGPDQPRDAASTRPNTAPSPSPSDSTTTNSSTTSFSTTSASSPSSPAGAPLPLPVPRLQPRTSLLSSRAHAMQQSWSREALQEEQDRPTLDDRSQSEEEKLADLANAHRIAF